MPKSHRLLPFSAALVIAIGEASSYPAGCNAHIFPDGAFRAEDGRPASMTGGDVLDWVMNAAVAARLIAALATSGKAILYDYEHNSLCGDSRAAGWIDKLVYVDGAGLFAHVEWTPDAAAAIDGKVYRYSSPFFCFDPKNGEITRLISVALTNNPALTELGGVGLSLARLSYKKEEEEAAVDKEEQAKLTTERDDLKTQVAALTTERDGLKTQVAALTVERDEAKTKLAALEQEKATAAATAEKEKHAALLAAALSDGRLTPAQKPWAEKQPLAALTEYLEATKPLPISTDPQHAPGNDKGNYGLNEDELAMCAKMGVTPEQFVAAKKQA